MRSLARFVVILSLLDTFIAMTCILAHYSGCSVLSFAPPSLMGNVVVFVVLNLFLGVFLGLPILVYRLAYGFVLMGVFPMINFAILLAMVLIVQFLADIEITTNILRFIMRILGRQYWW